MAKFLRRFVEDPRAVDAIVVVLATWFVLGGLASFLVSARPGRQRD